VAGRQLTVNGRGVCLYEYGAEHGSDAVRYFSPSLSGVVVPVDGSTGSTARTWTEFVHPDDKPWLLRLHDSAVADGLGYEALFRFARPGRRPVWVVDRQERTGELAERTWRGISLEVTDLVAPSELSGKLSNDRVDHAPPAPVPLQICCVSPPGDGDTADRRDGDAGLVGLPLRAAEVEALRGPLRERPSGAITVERVASDGDKRSTLLGWAPLGVAPAERLRSLVIADITGQAEATDLRHRRLHALAHDGAGVGFRLVPGGRARIPREWLRQVDPQLSSYSDLLNRVRRAEVRRLRTARRIALANLEGYCATLTVDLGGHTQPFVEAGLPDIAGAEWECVLLPLPSSRAGRLLDEVTALARAVHLDPWAQLLRSLGNEATVADALALLVRVGAHEAHVRRRLTMVVGDRDPGALAERYSHSLAGPAPAPAPTSTAR
jgi:hypothetical protein